MGNETIKITAFRTYGNNGANITSKRTNNIRYKMPFPVAFGSTFMSVLFDGSVLPVCLLSITPKLYVMPSVSNFNRKIVTLPISVDFVEVEPFAPLDSV